MCNCKWNTSLWLKLAVCVCLVPGSLPCWLFLSHSSFLCTTTTSRVLWLYRPSCFLYGSHIFNSQGGHRLQWATFGGFYGFGWQYCRQLKQQHKAFKNRILLLQQRRVLLHSVRVEPFFAILLLTVHPQQLSSVSRHSLNDSNQIFFSNDCGMIYERDHCDNSSTSNSEK